MPYINIDLDTIYDDLSSFEKNELISWLEDDGYIDNPDRLEYPTPIGMEDENIVRALLHILNNRDSLSNEDRDSIIGMGNRV